MVSYISKPLASQLLRCVGLLLTTFAFTMCCGQEPSKQSLEDDQLAVSGRYDRFERLLSQMADILGHDDPERAELLRRAISKGRERKISEQIASIAVDLGKGNLGTATEKQEQVTESLATLLKLLQSEDRRTAVERERERLNNILKGVQDAINQQRAARARTQNSSAPSIATPDQKQANEIADELLEEIQEHDDQQNKDQQQGNNSSKSDPSGESSENKDQSEQSQSDNQDSQQSSSDQQSSTDQKNSGEQDSDSQQTPGRQQLEKARRFMQEALEQLKKQEKDSAIDQQNQSLAQLNKAQRELEKILQQLREEEKEMILATLEARFQRMLAMETSIHETTLALAATPKEQWLDNLYSQARELSNRQNELAVDCSQTVALLKEDGTSVSIVVAVEDIETDMKSTAARLQESRVGAFTQTLQTDIIEALKELIEATQREMQEMKADQKPQQGQSGQQQEPPLVEMIAEIKVLRSLQLRVNRRTEQIDILLQEAGSDDLADLQEQLEELAIRQQRLRESAFELAERMKAR